MLTPSNCIIKTCKENAHKVYDFPGWLYPTITNKGSKVGYISKIKVGAIFNILKILT